ncbi:hypothetical protein QBC33DRAFT_548350 [Phialemonium atrogriseum]|uniref:DUF3494 domain-containing protein n=1 Tax=Phialemonium atrogriseum TaxID=1093897 RepID=A0AAJ0BSY7_9PEZI|nr:uncharacterized protein QBC33DRAFT_548350 [Phialemonium atrogriseum]KAK1763928.1 hypothetical protein QBC33DRAFT_548350 [Phialemonium atrogriseum]
MPTFSTMATLRLLGSALVLASIINAQVIDLGAASVFAVLGASTVTNTGFSVLGGDVGVYPGLAITGFPPGTATAIHPGDALAMQGQLDAQAAYSTAAATPAGPPENNLSGMNLGGLILPPGVYTFDSSAQLTGLLILDGAGIPDPSWIFQIASTLTTASDSEMVLIGAPACNVFWQVGSSATLGSASGFIGNIVALASVSMDSTASNDGSLIALTGAVTLIDNLVNAPCAAVVTTSSFATSTATVSTSMSSVTGETVITTEITTEITTVITSGTVTETTTEIITETSTETIPIPTSTSLLSSETATATTTEASTSPTVASTTTSTAIGSSTFFSTTSTETETTSTTTSPSVASTGTSTVTSSPSVTSSPIGVVTTQVTASTTSTLTVSGITHTPANQAAIVIIFTVTCPEAPTQISSHGQVFYIETPCTTVLTATPTPFSPTERPCEDCALPTSRDPDIPSEPCLTCSNQLATPTTAQLEGTRAGDSPHQTDKGSTDSNGSGIVTAAATSNWPNVAILAGVGLFPIVINLA